MRFIFITHFTINSSGGNYRSCNCVIGVKSGCFLKMPRGTSLSDIEKGKILALKDENHRISAIARNIDRSRRVVSNFLKDSESYGTVKRAGRKRNLSERDERKIARAASNSTLSCTKLAALAQTKVSKTTAWRVIKRNSNLVRSKMNCCPRLLSRHKTARLEFAKNNMATDWTSVCKIVVFIYLNISKSCFFLICL